MRARLLPGLALVAALSLTGCMADDYQANSGTGRVSVDISVNPGVKDAAISRTEASTINANDLMIRLSSEDGSFSQEWKLGEFPSNGEYVIGNYLMEAYYGAPENEGFDSPYYYGSTNFQIKHNQTSSVSFEVGLGNSMITLEFEDSFKNYLHDFKALLMTSSGKTLEYPATEEGKAIYVKPGNISLAMECTLPTGTEGRFNVADFTVEPKNHYKMVLGINVGDPTNPGAGSATLSISFDEALQKEPITIELSDELFNAPAPVINPTFDATQTLTLLEGETPTEPIALTLLAQGEFAQVRINTESASLTKKGWPREIDLMSASEADRAKLQNLGLKVLGLYQNPEQMAQLDFTGVAANISYVEGESNTNTFTVQVTDKNGKESEPVSFSIATTDIKCEILSHSMMVGSDNLKLTISYSGNNVRDNVKLSYMNELGSYNAHFTENSFTDNGNGTYSYDLTTTSTPKDPTYINVKVSYLDKELVKKLDCTFPDFSVASYDSFATYAMVDFVCSEDLSSVLDKAQYSISKDGGEYNAVTTEKVAGTNHLKISGLTPSTSYKVKCTLLGKESTGVASFTTEAATQLPNNGMEDWFRVDGKTKYWWIEYPGTDTNTVWGTMNLLTTSEGGTKTAGITNLDGNSYCAFSGTRNTTDSHSGNKAAIIETVGWGKGNTAASTAASICKNITAGELYLGSYNTSTKSPNYGYSFSSRPASLSFWYKYSPKNSADYGTALIKVLTSTGEVLSENQINLTTQSSYQQITLPLTYNSTNKAAQIIVTFKSSGNENCLTKNSDNISFGSGSYDSRHTGSSLYIDDIILNY